MLLAEILSAVRSQRTDSKRTRVIDLFAGYSSLRAVAKAQGLNYLAVDMRDLMSAAKGSTAGNWQIVAIESEGRGLAVGRLK